MITASDRTLSQNVTRLRKVCGLSQAALAEAMRERGQGHWRQTTVSRIETAKQAVSVGEAVELAAILGDVLADVLPQAATPASEQLRALNFRLAAAIHDMRRLAADLAQTVAEAEYRDR